MGFISRLDANNNGQLDPNEQGRARPFLERIARETGGLDLNRPIPLQSLASKIQQMQGGGGSDQSRDRSRSRDRGSSPARNSGDRRYDDDAASAAEGLVPGFNEIPEDLIPPVGFGSKAEYLNVDVIQADFDEADNTIKRYDRNRNGVLEQDEIRNAKWIYGNPMNQDRNGDGKLTKSELAVRYSIRRDTQSAQAREKLFVNPRIRKAVHHSLVASHKVDHPHLEVAEEVAGEVALRVAVIEWLSLQTAFFSVTTPTRVECLKKMNGRIFAPTPVAGTSIKMEKSLEMN